MSIPSARLFALALASTFAAAALSGCHVTSHKNGKNDNVDIGTPFGSMSVKTNDNVNSSSIGLSIYPGATPIKDDGDKSDAADVNMSFGSFRLGVKAASYQTSDSEEKVLAFYRKDMAHYGSIIECRGNSAVGKPDRTAEGLSCSDGGHVHISVEKQVGNDFELRAGSPQHQHIVSVETRDGGTKIGLVMLNLPTQIHSHGDQQSE